MKKREAHDSVRRILDELEDRIDPDLQKQIRQRHTKSALWEKVDRPPLLLVPPWDSREPALHPVSEAVTDPSKMLANELRRGFSSIVRWLRIQDDKPLQVRPDFGIGLVAGVFGARLEVVENNPPWVHPIESDNKKSSVEGLLDRLDIGACQNLGWLPRVAETLDYYTETLRQYPNVASSVAVALPDLQGAFDNAAMLWGSDIFLALVTEPELIQRLLAAVARTMVHLHNWLRRWVGRELLPEGFSHQHGGIIRGNILLRCDSNVMVHPDMYASRIFPHELQVLRSVGGGSYHSCGRWMHNIPAVINAEEVGSLDFGTNQSHMNEMHLVYGWARERRKHLHLVAVSPEELRNGRVPERYPTGVTLQCSIDSAEEAVVLMDQYASQA
ncbi:MAG TPA: hypothetical protein VMX75_03380 [Spirochaetia bacterium]|nr:hypothetical protein [Spirochaetia bacterium]